MKNNNSIDSIKELLNAAINKNQVTFAQAAKVAENVGSGLLKLKLNESGKTVDFEFMNKKISIDLNRLRINGVKYLNDLLVDDIMTKVDLSQFEELIKQIQEELEDKTRLITSITDYPFCIFDTPNRTQVLIGHDLHNCINIGHNTEEGASFIANSPYGASIELCGNTVKCNKNLTVPGTITSPTIDDINTRLNQTESTLNSVEDKTQMMTSTANELTINTNGGYPLRIYGSTNYTRLVLGSNATNCLYLGYNKPLNLAYLKTNGGGEVKVTATDLECSNLNLKVSGTITSPTITNLENSIADIKTDILKSIYPVGCIYTSMTSTNPAILFGFGTWTQIKDRFLYCTTSSKSTGGSKKITIQNLPAHSHESVTATDMIGNPDGANDTSDGAGREHQYWRGNKAKILEYGSATTSSTGGGTDYMPPYMTVYAWHRTA